MKDILKRDARGISISIGALYSIIGLFALLVTSLQIMMMRGFDNQDSDEFFELLRTLSETWNIFMPLLIFLGLLYLLFGWKYHSIRDNAKVLSIVLSILSLIWVVLYFVVSIPYLKLFFSVQGEDFEAFKYVGYLFASIGFCVVLAIFTVPQFAIIKKVHNEIDNIAI